MKIRAWDGLDAYNNHSIEEVSKNDLCSQHDDLTTRGAIATLLTPALLFSFKLELGVFCSCLLSRFINLWMVVSV